MHLAQNDRSKRCQGKPERKTRCSVYSANQGWKQTGSKLISTALPAMSSTAYGAPPVTSFTSAKQDEGW